MSARWSVTQVLTAMGFGRWTHRDTVHCCIISRVTLHSLAPRSSDRSFKHLLSCFVRDLFIYCSISVVEPRVTEQRVTNWWKLSQVYHNVRTESLGTFVFFSPTPGWTKHRPALSQWILSFLLPKQLQLCAFTSMWKCKSCSWVYLKERSAFLCAMRPFFVCVHVVPALCQSVYILRSLPSVLHLALAVNHVCLFPLFEPCFCLLVSLAVQLYFSKVLIKLGADAKIWSMN